MKPITILKAGSLLLVILALLTTTFSCDPDSDYVRVRRIYWENVWYKANYNLTGRLISLTSTSSSVLFYYDEDNELYKAEITIPGGGSPKYVYNFVQSEHGISEVILFKDGVEFQRDIINYSATGEITSIRLISESLPFNQDVTFEATFTDGNLTRLEQPYDDIEADLYFYNLGLEFDDKINPFMMLAEAVGNPVFFPVGRFWFYPLGEPINPEFPDTGPVGEDYQYEISYISRFSKNNPIEGFFLLAHTDFGESSQYEYSYTHNLVRSITWIDYDVQFDLLYRSKQMYRFEYEVAARP